MTNSISASHAATTVADEINAANLKSILAREAARAATAYRPPPIDPVLPVTHAAPAGRPASSSSPDGEVDDAPFEPPKVPPGWLVLSPTETEIMDRLIQTHPELAGQFEGMA